MSTSTEPSGLTWYSFSCSGPAGCPQFGPVRCLAQSHLHPGGAQTAQAGRACGVAGVGQGRLHLHLPQPSPPLPGVVREGCRTCRPPRCTSRLYNTWARRHGTAQLRQPAGGTQRRPSQTKTQRLGPRNSGHKYELIGVPGGSIVARPAAAQLSMAALQTGSSRPLCCVMPCSPPSLAAPLPVPSCKPTWQQASNCLATTGRPCNTLGLASLTGDCDPAVYFITAGRSCGTNCCACCCLALSLALCADGCGTCKLP